VFDYIYFYLIKFM